MIRSAVLIFFNNRTLCFKIVFVVVMDIRTMMNIGGVLNVFVINALSWDDNDDDGDDVDDVWKIVVLMIVVAGSAAKNGAGAGSWHSYQLTL